MNIRQLLFLCIQDKDAYEPAIFCIQPSQEPEVRVYDRRGDIFMQMAANESDARRYTSLDMRIRELAQGMEF